MAAPDKYEERLKATLLETGFPLELEVDDTLRERGWATFPNQHYVDDEEGVGREIDNWALFPSDSKKEKEFDPLGVSPHLTVECKAWNEISVVVLCRNLSAVTSYDFSGQVYNFPWLIDHRLPPLDMTKEFDFGWFLT